MQPTFEIIRMQPENTNSVLMMVGGDAIIFDPWGSADAWRELLASRGLNLIATYSTHGHPDHISAAPFLDAPWYMSHRDIPLVFGMNRFLKHYGLPEIEPGFKQPVNISAGKSEILNQKSEIILTPGHSAGGVAFYFPDGGCLTPPAGAVSAQQTRGVIIIGDTLFQETIGRYDYPGGDYNALMQSIKKIYDINLPDDTIVIHGHGMHTTIGWLKKHNPYFTS